MYSLKVENQVNLPEESMNQVLELSVLPNRTKEEIRLDLTSIANEICRYWCLKRELKNGAPLVRKNNDFGTLGTGSGSGSTMSGSLLYDFNNLELNGPNESQINEKIKFANVLVQDLSRLILMNEFNTQRQVVAKEIDDMAFSIADMYYFPLSQVIKLSIEKLNSKYDPGHVILNYVPKTTTKDINCCKSLKAMMRHNERNGYENIQQFKSDVDVLAATIWKENKPSSNVCKKMKVWKREFDKEIARIAVNDDEGSNELVPMSKLSANGLEVTAENIGDENLSGYVDDGGQNTGMVNTLLLEDVEMRDRKSVV